MTENNENNDYIRRGECEMVRRATNERIEDTRGWLSTVDKRLWAITVGSAGTAILVLINIVVTIILKT